MLHDHAVRRRGRAGLQQGRLVWEWPGCVLQQRQGISTGLASALCSVVAEAAARAVSAVTAAWLPRHNAEQAKEGDPLKGPLEITALPFRTLQRDHGPIEAKSREHAIALWRSG